MRQKLQQALIYPAIMMTVSLGIIIFLLAFVVPKIITVFTDIGQQLPILTRLLIGMSDFVNARGWLLIILLLALLIGWRLLMRNEWFHYELHRIILKLPLFGKMTRIVNTARFSRSLSILSSSGVDVMQSMRVAAQLIHNIPMQESVKEAAERVREGASIHRALGATGYFLPITLHFIANGEKSGRLEEMLLRAADYQDRHVALVIDTLLAIFEPVLILTMGMVVLFIVLAILLPIFEMTQVLQ